jgi:hypothetical protein
MFAARRFLGRPTHIGSRVLALASHRDSALQLLESVSDLIADSAPSRWLTRVVGNVQDVPF